MLPQSGVSGHALDARAGRGDWRDSAQELSRPALEDSPSLLHSEPCADLRLGHSARRISRAALVRAWSMAAGTKSMPSTSCPAVASVIARSPDPQPTSRNRTGGRKSPHEIEQCGLRRSDVPRWRLVVHLAKEVLGTRSESTHEISMHDAQMRLADVLRSGTADDHASLPNVASQPPCGCREATRDVVITTNGTILES